MPLAFPTLPSGELLDSSQFTIEMVDNTIRQEVEGGYTYTRPRTTRRNRKVWKCQYTFLPEADRAVLETFWQSAAGNSLIFTWVSPQNLVTYSVRFKGPMTFRYVGKGALQRWDCSFDLELV
jgi:hypothetical protein